MKWNSSLLHSTFVLALTALIGIPTASAVCVNWRITDLGTLGGADSRAMALNERGQVVGFSTTVTGETHAFLWEHGGLRNLGTLGGTNSRAFGINNKGDVVGQSEISLTSTEPQAFVYRQGTMQHIDTGEGSSVANDINERGDVVGTMQKPSSPTPFQQRAFLYRKGALVDLSDIPVENSGPMYTANAINSKGQIVGSGALRDSALYSNGTVALIDVGAGFSAPNDINDNGQIVGWRSTRVPPLPGFLYDKGTVTSIGPDGTIPLAINNRGQIVGELPGNSAFLYTDGQLIDLNTLPAVQAEGWTLRSAQDVNQCTEIVGYGEKDGVAGTRAYLLTPTGAGCGCGGNPPVDNTPPQDDPAPGNGSNNNANSGGCTLNRNAAFDPALPLLLAAAGGMLLRRCRQP